MKVNVATNLSFMVFLRAGSRDIGIWPPGQPSLPIRMTQPGNQIDTLCPRHLASAFVSLPLCCRICGIIVTWLITLYPILADSRMHIYFAHYHVWELYHNYTDIALTQRRPICCALQFNSWLQLGRCIGRYILMNCRYVCFHERESYLPSSWSSTYQTV